MKTLSPHSLKWLKFFHLFFAITWIGSAIGMNVLRHAVTPSGAEEMYMLSLCIKILDDILIWVGVMGCLLTGLIYGIWTKWGFFKQRWITIKWILTAVMMISGTFLVGPAVQGNVQPLDWYGTHMAEFVANQSASAIWGGSQVVILVIVLLLSVFKPIKKRAK